MGKEIIYNALTGEVTEVEVEDLQNIDELRANTLTVLMDTYKKKIIEGFITSCTGTPISFSYSQQDQLNYSKIANLFSLNPAKTSTILGSDSHGVVTLSKEQFLLFMEDAESYEMNMYVKRKQLEQQIVSATTIEELNSIVINF